MDPATSITISLLNYGLSEHRAQIKVDTSYYHSACPKPLYEYKPPFIMDLNPHAVAMRHVEEMNKCIYYSTTVCIYDEKFHICDMAHVPCASMLMVAVCEVHSLRMCRLAGFTRAARRSGHGGATAGRGIGALAAAVRACNRRRSRGRSKA
eukprot:6185519-Pleurochrysis_carterae.AAC.5